MIQKINKTNFKETINSTEPVLVKFSSNWCGPCKVVGKTLEEIQPTLPCKVYEVDVDENMELCDEYNITNIPVIMLFKSSEMLKKHVGLVSKEEIEQFVK